MLAHRLSTRLATDCPASSARGNQPRTNKCTDSKACSGSRLHTRPRGRAEKGIYIGWLQNDLYKLHKPGKIGTGSLTQWLACQFTNTCFRAPFLKLKVAGSIPAGPYFLVFRLLDAPLLLLFRVSARLVACMYAMHQFAEGMFLHRKDAYCESCKTTVCLSPASSYHRIA
jgi:hypothetical protein